jgi:formylglycine-generating enzyme required for sulfatase activity
MRLAAACALLVVAAPPAPVEPPAMRFVRVPAGEFVMGSPPGEPQREDQETQHVVRLTQPFEIGEHEVTQGEWWKVLGTSPSAHAGCSDCPVENVSFLEVQDFLRELNRRFPGRHYRLPTEAEWERACRAGTTAPFATGSTLDTSQANFNGRWPYAGGRPGPSPEATTRVGSYPANAWGLHDMHGNVWEWCADWHCPYPAGPVSDPVGSCSSGRRVIRGGSWLFGADSARCATRYDHPPDQRGPSLGFRLVRDASP